MQAGQLKVPDPRGARLDNTIALLALLIIFVLFPLVGGAVVRWIATQIPESVHWIPRGGILIATFFGTIVGGAQGKVIGFNTKGRKALLHDHADNAAATPKSHDEGRAEVTFNNQATEAESIQDLILFPEEMLVHCTRIAEGNCRAH